MYLLCFYFLQSSSPIELIDIMTYGNSAIQLFFLASQNSVPMTHVMSLSLPNSLALALLLVNFLCAHLSKVIYQLARDLWGIETLAGFRDSVRSLWLNISMFLQ